MASMNLPRKKSCPTNPNANMCQEMLSRYQLSSHRHRAGVRLHVWLLFACTLFIPGPVCTVTWLKQEDLMHCSLRGKDRLTCVGWAEVGLPYLEGCLDQEAGIPGPQHPSYCSPVHVVLCLCAQRNASAGGAFRLKGQAVEWTSHHSRSDSPGG